MEDEKVIKQLNPTWRKVLLSCHQVLTTVATAIWSPVTYVLEQLDGTADCRDRLNQMETAEYHQKRLAESTRSGSASTNSRS